MEKLTREITASHHAVKISLFDFNNNNRVSPRCDRRSLRIILSLQKYQKTDKNDGAEHKQTDNSNDRYLNPNYFFCIDCLIENISIGRYMFLVNGIANNYKEKKNDQTYKDDVR
jgi:hypothetical protein